jgi:hypothetical protein
MAILLDRKSSVYRSATTRILGMNRNSTYEYIRIIVSKTSCHPHENLLYLVSIFLGCLIFAVVHPCLLGPSMQCQPIAGTTHTPFNAFTRVSQFFSVHDELSQLSPHTILYPITHSITYLLNTCYIPDRCVFQSWCYLIESCIFFCGQFFGLLFL